jgi:hypothetical protein
VHDHLVVGLFEKQAVIAGAETKQSFEFAVKGLTSPSPASA